MPAWFFVPDLHVGINQLSPEESHHAVRVRRVEAGEPVVLFDGAGNLGTGRIRENAAGPGARNKGLDAVLVEIEEVRRQDCGSRRLHLLLPGAKGERLSWLTEKGTELGVHSFLFVKFDRSVVPVEDRQLERLRRVALEACKQCGRAAIPEFSAEQPLRERVANIQMQNAGVSLAYGSPDSEAEPAAAYFSRARVDGFVVVGPEGGLSGAEEAILAQGGAKPVRIGGYTLRIETAAIALAAAWAARGTGLGGHG